TLVNVTTGTAIGSLTVPRPEGIVEGDLLFATVAHDDRGNVVMPPGWEMLTNVIFSTDCNGDDDQLYFGWKRAAADEPAAYTFPWPNSPWPTNAVIAAFRGIDVDSVKDWKSTVANTTPVASLTCPSLSVASTDLVVVGAASVKSLGASGW